MQGFSNIINDLATNAKDLIARYRQHGELQKPYIDLLGNHSSMVTAIRKDTLVEVKDCPLCGHRYDDITAKYWTTCSYH
jgi:hypothetical protein